MELSFCASGLRYNLHELGPVLLLFIKAAFLGDGSRNLSSSYYRGIHGPHRESLLSFILCGFIPVPLAVAQPGWSSAALPAHAQLSGCALTAGRGFSFSLSEAQLSCRTEWEGAT